MGYNMKLLVLEKPESIYDPSGVTPDSVLNVRQNYSILGQIIDLSAYRSTGLHDIPARPCVPLCPIPERFWLDWQGEMIRRNAYNAPLMWASAKEFKKLVVPDGAHSFNKALKAYIDQLPDDTPIIVWLH